MGYVFFDCETTGLSPAFDQIVHFAAIHTDHELKELDRFEARSRLQPHVVPHPVALLTNGLSIDRLTDTNLPSYGATVARIREKLLDWSPAIFAGYNSIEFDEEMLRNALFQNLFDPYLTSKPGSGRADVYGLIQTTFMLSPGCMKFPGKSDGTRDFRLASLLRANNLAVGPEHDAMSDTIGTVELCRMLMAREPEAWQRFVRLSNKAAVAEFVDQDEGFVLSEFYGGEAHHRAVACLGTTAKNPNARFCIDLACEPGRWSAMSDAEVDAEICRKGTPLRRLKVNGAPILTSLDDAQELIPEVDIDQARNRAFRYRDSQEIGTRLIAIYTRNWGEAEPSPFPEACLYSGGFVGDQDRRICDQFHASPWPVRDALASHLSDSRLRSLAKQLIYSEHRSIVAPEDRGKCDRALAERLLHTNEGPLNLVDALEATDNLLAEANNKDSKLLSGYRQYIAERIERTRDFLDEN